MHKNPAEQTSLNFLFDKNNVKVDILRRILVLSWRARWFGLAQGAESILAEEDEHAGALLPRRVTQAPDNSIFSNQSIDEKYLQSLGKIMENLPAY